MWKLESAPGGVECNALCVARDRRRADDRGRADRVLGARQESGRRLPHLLPQSCARPQCGHRAPAEGDAADADRGGTGGRLSRERVEHRCGRPVPDGRGGGDGRRAGLPEHGEPARAAGDDRCRRDRRRTVGGDPGALEDEIQRQRNPDVADARLYRAARGLVARLRAVEGSGRLQFSADRNLHRLGIAADPDRRHSPQFRFPDCARRARWRLRLHAEELLGFQDARCR